MVRIFEIFTSIEGEGILYGTKTLFVRLAGCPFDCFYCDTTEALPADSGTEYTLKEAIKLIDDSLQKNTFKANFTGGEPLMQHEAVAILAEHIQSCNISTYLESSCFDSGRFAYILPYLDYAKIEFKTPDSKFVNIAAQGRAYQNALKCLEMAVQADIIVYIKVVVSSMTSTDYIRSLADEVFDTVSDLSVSGFVLQPTYGIREPSLNALMDMYDAIYPTYNKVRIVPQMHKQIGAP